MMLIRDVYGFSAEHLISLFVPTSSSQHVFPSAPFSFDLFLSLSLFLSFLLRSPAFEVPPLMYSPKLHPGHFHTDAVAAISDGTVNSQDKSFGAFSVLLFLTFIVDSLRCREATSSI